MSPPKHLWSGDWQEDSAAAAEALNRRRPKSSKQPKSEASTEVKPRFERPRSEPKPIRAPEAKPRSVQATPPPARATPPPARATPPAARPATPPAPKAPPQPKPRSATPRGPGRRPSGRALVIFAITALLVAGGAIAVIRALGGDTQKPALTGSARPWLGIQMENVGVGGVTVTTVFPNGPADNAGVTPGDVITQIDNQSVSTTAEVNAALSGLRAGQQVEITLQRGPLTYTTEATLANWPPGNHP